MILSNVFLNLWKVHRLGAPLSPFDKLRVRGGESLPNLILSLSKDRHRAELVTSSRSPSGLILSLSKDKGRFIEN